MTVSVRVSTPEGGEFEFLIEEHSLVREVLIRINATEPLKRFPRLVINGVPLSPVHDYHKQIGEFSDIQMIGRVQSSKNTSLRDDLTKMIGKFIGAIIFREVKITIMWEEFDGFLQTGINSLTNAYWRHRMSHVADIYGKPVRFLGGTDVMRVALNKSYEEWDDVYSCGLVMTADGQKIAVGTNIDKFHEVQPTPPPPLPSGFFVGQELNPDAVKDTWRFCDRAEIVSIDACTVAGSITINQKNWLIVSTCVWYERGHSEYVVLDYDGLVPSTLIL